MIHLSSEKNSKANNREHARLSKGQLHLLHQLHLHFASVNGFSGDANLESGVLAFGELRRLIMTSSNHWSRSNQSSRQLTNLVVVGDGGVGKSSLTIRFAQGHFGARNANEHALLMHT